MIDSKILEEIESGNLVEIHIKKSPQNSTPGFENEVRNTQAWLRQFNKGCGPHRCIYFSEKSNPEGDVTLEITIGIIPNSQHEVLVRQLQFLGTNAPFEITFRT